MHTFSNIFSLGVCKFECLEDLTPNIVISWVTFSWLNFFYPEALLKGMSKKKNHEMRLRLLFAALHIYFFKCLRRKDKQDH